jgi:exosortase H (IPTLxxWG-CTERM-specific)
VNPSSSAKDRSPRRFLLLFGGFLIAFYLLIGIHPVNDAVVVPFTGAVARASGALLTLIGERVVVAGTSISSHAFSVNVENGCNGLETALLLAAAVLAFPASGRQKVAGFVLGFLSIEAVNLIRVASLFWVGAHRPAWFGPAHTIVWQSLVVLAGVGLFVGWAGVVARHRARPDAR